MWLELLFIINRSLGWVCRFGWLVYRSDYVTNGGDVPRPALGQFVKRTSSRCDAGLIPPGPWGVHWAACLRFKSHWSTKSSWSIQTGGSPNLRPQSLLKSTKFPTLKFKSFICQVQSMCTMNVFKTATKSKRIWPPPTHTKKYAGPVITIKIIIRRYVYYII